MMQVEEESAALNHSIRKHSVDLRLCSGSESDQKKLAICAGTHISPGDGV